MADVRPYRPRDRAAVREICRATAYGGREPLLDPRLFTDLMTRYYTDFTPEAVWVAEHRERVVGYLAGCFDEAALRRVMSRRIVPAAVARSVARGLILRRAFWRLTTALPQFLAAERHAKAVDLSDYPANLHINLMPEARGCGVGERLMAQLCAEAARRGLPGVHATVLEENRSARRFFERLGFAERTRRPVLRPPAGRGRLAEKIVYCKEL
jgi:ribosomal protein S18 acetylase RimI-like enzyme